MVTVAMVGYDGGRVAAEGLADHVVVSRSEHIPRIQEAQASAYHALRELVEARERERPRGAARRDRGDGDDGHAGVHGPRRDREETPPEASSASARVGCCGRSRASAGAAVELLHWSTARRAAPSSGAAGRGPAPGVGGPGVRAGGVAGLRGGAAPVLGLSARRPKGRERAGWPPTTFSTASCSRRPATAAGRVIRVGRRVEGTVQGVGFRPFVHRLAAELDLAGWVLNDERGVLLEVEGEAGGGQLLAPAGGRRAAARLRGERARRGAGGARRPRVRDRGERAAAGRPTPRSRPTSPPARTACGSCSTPPTAATGIRSSTAPTAARGSRSCAAFPTTGRSPPWPASTMCEACRAEYDDPADRRFHAQPNACPECGRASLGRSHGVDPRRSRAALRAGRDRGGQGARRLPPRLPRGDEEAVAALRARKHREDKPFALMAPDLEAARALVELGRPEEELLLPGASGRS